MLIEDYLDTNSFIKHIKGGSPYYDNKHICSQLTGISYDASDILLAEIVNRIGFERVYANIVLSQPLKVNNNPIVTENILRLVYFLDLFDRLKYIIITNNTNNIHNTIEIRIFNNNFTTENLYIKLIGVTDNSVSWYYKTIENSLSQGFITIDHDKNLISVLEKAISNIEPPYMYKI